MTDCFRQIRKVRFLMPIFGGWGLTLSSCGHDAEGGRFRSLLLLRWTRRRTDSRERRWSPCRKCCEINNFWQMNVSEFHIYLHRWLRQLRLHLQAPQALELLLCLGAEGGGSGDGGRGRFGVLSLFLKRKYIGSIFLTHHLCGI